MCLDPTPRQGPRYSAPRKHEQSSLCRASTQSSGNLPNLALHLRSQNCNPPPPPNPLLRIPRRGHLRGGRCAKCAPKLRKIAGISFHASGEGCAKSAAKLSQIRKSISANFMQTALFQCPLLQIRESLEMANPASAILETQKIDLCPPPRTH